MKRDDTSQLTQELETVLKTFRSHLSPFSEEQKTTDDLYPQLEQNAAIIRQLKEKLNQL